MFGYNPYGYQTRTRPNSFPGFASAPYGYYDDDSYEDEYNRAIQRQRLEEALRQKRMQEIQEQERQRKLEAYRVLMEQRRREEEAAREEALRRVEEEREWRRRQSMASGYYPQEFLDEYENPFAQYRQARPPVRPRVPEQENPIDVLKRSAARRAASHSPQRSAPIHDFQQPPASIPVPTQESQSPAEPAAPLRPFYTEEQRQEAATKIQQAYRLHRSISTISAIRSKFTTLRESFVFPSSLDFVSPTDESNTVLTLPTRLSEGSESNDEEESQEQKGPQLKLAYTSANAPLHGYVESLNRLLISLDGVESFGDKKVRKLRKDAVGEVEREAARVEGVWKKTAAARTPTKNEVPLDSEEVGVERTAS